MMATPVGADRRDGARHPLRIAGITPFSTVDWPGKLACVAFLAGCPWACPYCQNFALQRVDSARLTGDDLFGFLQTRRGLLDAAVFSGGEPLAQAAVVDAAREARELGFEVGLHTCGAYPERLREMLDSGCVSWVGLDVKAPWEGYDKTTRGHGSAEAVQESLDALLSAGVKLEVRTTWHPDLLSEEDMAAIAHDLAARGVRTWAVQAYRHQGTNGELADVTVYPSDLPEGLSALFEQFEFRRA